MSFMNLREANISLEISEVNDFALNTINVMQETTICKIDISNIHRITTEVKNMKTIEELEFDARMENTTVEEFYSSICEFTDEYDESYHAMSE